MMPLGRRHYSKPSVKRPAAKPVQRDPGGAALWSKSTPRAPKETALERTTLGITTFLRPASLARCLASIQTHYDGARVVVEDTDGNLSSGRNRIVKQSNTEFLWVLEDDFQLTDDTSLAALVDVLDSDEEVGVACGRLYQVRKSRYEDYALNIRRFRGVLECAAPSSPWQTARNGTVFRHIDMGWNFFVARRQVLREYKWDESLPLREHAAWFWRLKDGSRWRVAFVPRAVAKHHQDRPTEEYREARSNTKVMQPYLRKHYGFDTVVGNEVVELEPRHNIVVLGVGHSNTSLTAKQLFALGWSAGDADAEYGESVSIRRVNEMYAASGKFDHEQATHALGRLTEPWAVKDPRFCVTLPEWAPLMVPFAPMLLWVRKSRKAVLESYRKRGENAQWVDRNYALARQHFNSWPWSKLSVDAESIGDASSLFMR